MPVAQGTSIRLAAACLAGALLAAISACGGGDPDPTASPTASPVATTAVPVEVEVDFSRAEQLYYEGDYEQALTIYAAAAQRGTGAEKQEGLLGLARIQADRGDNSGAERNLEAYRETDPTPDDDRVALLMLGRAELAQGDLDEAREAIEEYVALEGPAAPYAMLYLAQIANGEDKPDEAIEQINLAMEADLPAQTRTDALMMLGELYATKDDHASAAAAYQRAADNALYPYDVAEAVWFFADEAVKANDTPSATRALSNLIRSYPETERARQALDHPLAAQIPEITARERALVLFRNFYNDDAFAAFQPIIAAGGVAAAEAEYHTGILHERWELWDDAIAHYDQAISLLASGENETLRAQSTWDRATVLERIGRIDEAIAGYAAVAEISPAHEQADDAVFRAGMLSYQLGRPGDAQAYWARYASTVPDAEEEARANFWLAKAAEALGDSEGASVYYGRAAEAAPLDYYGLRAAERVSPQGFAPSTIPVEAPTSDWDAADTWLAAQYGIEDVVATEALFASAAWLRAVELVDAGLGDRADDEFGALLEIHALEPWLVYGMVRAIDELGRPWVSSPAAFGLMAVDAPREIFRLVYPLEFWDLVRKEASANDISPFLMLALMRQESLYQPDAVSSADALGLTQVIPTTGEGIAQQLGVEFRQTDLLRPRVSVQFGSYYLGQQIAGFGGNVAVALSGYNGGPGNAARWWEASGDDVDLFVETIDYPETRSYVELVLENYARYLYAYGEADAPVLPED